MKSRSLGCLSLLVCLLFFFSPAVASQSAWVQGEHVKARLVASESDAQPLEMALQVQLENGWHSYWRSPGDAGLPFRFDFSGSENLEGYELFWPVPKVFEEGEGLITYGYDGNLVMPIAVQRSDGSMDAQVVLMLHLMVCHELCLPQSLSLRLDLPAGYHDVSNAALIGFGKRSVPRLDDMEALSVVGHEIDGERLKVSVHAPEGLRGAEIFVEQPESGYVWHKKADITTKEPQSEYDFIIDADEAWQGQDVILTLVRGADAIERRLGL